MSYNVNLSPHIFYVTYRTYFEKMAVTVWQCVYYVQLVYIMCYVIMFVVIKLYLF